jgi:hypothetical protein
MELICSAPYQQTADQVNKRYVSHPMFRESENLTWPMKTDIPCYHCLEPFEGTPFFLPMEFRPDRHEYVGYGIFCWPSCAKRYGIEHPMYNTPNQMTYLAQLAREMGITEPVCPAPPQIRLRRMGGDLTVDKFRELSRQNVHVVVHHPPFITWAMVFEERRRNTVTEASENDDAVMEPQTVESFPGMLQKPEEERWKVTGLRAPSEPAVGDTSAIDMDVCQPVAAAYDQFLEQKRVGSIAISSAAAVINKSNPVPLPKGSTMKAPHVKRQRSAETSATKTTKTSAADVPQAPKQVATDLKRGSLRAFMKQRQPI